MTGEVAIWKVTSDGWDPEFVEADTAEEAMEIYRTEASPYGGGEYVKPVEIQSVVKMSYRVLRRETEHETGKFSKIPVD